MKIQELVSDVRGRVEDAGKQSQAAFAAYRQAQKKVVGVVTKNGQTLASTEMDAAKNVFAAARASFDQARKDGMVKVASEPKTYVPFDSRDDIISAYKSTIDLLVKTGNELTSIVSDGYKSVRSSWNGKPAAKKKAPARQKRTASKATGSTASKSAASTKKAAPAKAASTNAASAKKATATKVKPAARKTTAKRKTATASTGKATTAAAGKSTAKRTTSKRAASNSTAQDKAGTSVAE